ncbi:MAG: type II secretion system protein, partial [Planctomycetes bacterium]|nr:type II secretion system protein [Planctomycetota bacterium]
MCRGVLRRPGWRRLGGLRRRGRCAARLWALRRLHQRSRRQRRYGLRRHRAHPAQHGPLPVMQKHIRSRSGFTLVELLVVIAVIALLLGLMLPAIGSFRARARASVSMSNLRQWGIGYSNFASDRKGLIPWEGLKDAKDMVTNLNDLQRYWANAVAPMVDQAPYADIAVDNASVPVPPQGSNIFIDPAAQPPVDGSGSFKGWLIPGTTKRFYFSYVPNSQL